MNLDDVKVEWDTFNTIIYKLTTIFPRFQHRDEVLSEAVAEQQRRRGVGRHPEFRQTNVSESWRIDPQQIERLDEARVVDGGRRRRRRRHR